MTAPSDPVAGLLELLPPDCVLEGEAAHAWSVWGVPPRAVAFPRSTDEAALVLARASEEGWMVEPAGSGTWLASGNPAGSLDFVLSAERMDAVIEHEPGDLTITVGSGMRLSSLDARLAPHNQWLPLEPAGQCRTLGAVASTGAWGPLYAAWGGPRDLTLGLRGVTGDGRAFRAGGRVVKNVAGFDLVRLMIGSRGTLAFITEVTLRLYPRPALDRTLVVRGRRLEELVPSAVAVSSQVVTPAAVEVFERPREGHGEREAVLAVRLTGLDDQVRAEEGIVRAALSTARAGAVEVLRAKDAATLWREIRMLEEDADLATCLSLAPARLAETVDLARAVIRMSDGEDAPDRSAARISAHADAGVLRLACPFLASDPGRDERCADGLAGVRRSLARAGGSLTVTRGPAGVLERVGAWDPAGSAVELMEGLKRAFDPAGILSRGRFVLDPSGRGGP